MQVLPKKALVLVGRDMVSGHLRAKVRTQLGGLKKDQG